ncbi:DUF2163 domain-containing protein [Pseudoprimorskyibacter insulae]|nr:DUF2163 domain-containing protein [Pseudoprimorskyibacter insulae]
MNVDGFHQHMKTGLTTVSHAWAVVRKDGVAQGFTDHDRDLRFDDMLFRADSGLSAAALQQGTGLSVDNSEAVGALSATAITEADIAAGRYDGAEVVAWLVNWADTSERKILFRGHIGEIIREGAAFRAELRGLTEFLNRPVGRVFQAPCSAVLGDASCGFDLSGDGFFADGVVMEIESADRFVIQSVSAQPPQWFQRGACAVLSGAAEGLTRAIKRDEPLGDGLRRVQLWEELRAPLTAGDSVRVTAGCDKRFETCRLKFANTLNFQGFPDIPSDDWVAVSPSSTAVRDGGSRR